MKVFMLIAALVSGCISQHRTTPRHSALQQAAKSLCEVMKDPSLYIGQRIMVKGLYIREPHQRILYDADCPHWNFRVSHAVSSDGDPAAKRMIKRAARKDPTVNIPVVYYGNLAAKVVIVGCVELSCYSYSLEDAQLLAASPY